MTFEVFDGGKDLTAVPNKKYRLWRCPECDGGSATKVLQTPIIGTDGSIRGVESFVCYHCIQRGHLSFVR